MVNDELDIIWKEKPEFIRQYYDLYSNYVKLCDEIKYTLALKLDLAKLEYAQIVSRVKSLDSFCEKIFRKNYLEPFRQITDIAGVRLVYLYPSDLKYVEDIVEREFEIIEKIDKVSIGDEDKFGYGAIHYLVKIKLNNSGARYDDLKNFISEIQVRTILQDAWANVAHHLSYKQESDIPKELRRKLNALAGLFETADDQFNNLRKAREEYQQKIKDSIPNKRKGMLDEEVNFDNIIGYMNWKFPDRKQDNYETVSILLEELKIYKYLKLSMIDSMIDCSLNAVKALEQKYPPTDKETQLPTVYSAVGIVRSALSFTNSDYRNKIFSGKLLEQRKEFLHLLKKDA